jgi:hypothetical protein
LREPGLVPRVDGVSAEAFHTPPPRAPLQHRDYEFGRFISPPQPQHPVSGRFMVERHALHADRNVKGEYIDEGDYAD